MIFDLVKLSTLETSINKGNKFSYVGRGYNFTRYCTGFLVLPSTSSAAVDLAGPHTTEKSASSSSVALLIVSLCTSASWVIW